MKNPGIMPGKIHVTYPPTMLPVITGTRYRTSLKIINLTYFRRGGAYECVCLEFCGELHRSNLRSALDDGVHNLVKAGIARRARDTINVLQVQVGSPGAETHSDRHTSLDADNPCLRLQACGAEGIGDSTVGESAMRFCAKCNSEKATS